MANLPILDSHVHLWDTLNLDYPWLNNARAIRRPFLMPDFRSATNGLGVREFVFVEAGAAPAHSLDEVRWIDRLAASNPEIVGIVANVDVSKGDAIRQHLVDLRSIPRVKSVRRGLQGEKANLCLKPDFIAGVQTLDEFDLAFDLLLTHTQLEAATELVRQCPDVRFIVDHIAKPDIAGAKLDPWRQDLAALAALPNVACKISGMITEAGPKWTADNLRPYVSHVLEVFGPDRVMYGGDWPVCTLAGTYEKMLAATEACVAGLPEADRAKFFRGNAVTWYRLDV